MTNVTSAAIRAELAENSHALQQAREDIATAERIKAARPTATKLMKRGDELTTMLAKALEAEKKAAAAEAVAERDALFAGSPI